MAGGDKEITFGKNVKDSKKHWKNIKSQKSAVRANFQKPKKGIYIFVKDQISEIKK